MRASGAVQQAILPHALCNASVTPPLHKKSGAPVGAPDKSDQL
jgi:hypothetical protein